MSLLLSFVVALLIGASATAAYLWLFHDEVATKEVGSTAFAIALGFTGGRWWERRTSRG